MAVREVEKAQLLQDTAHKLSETKKELETIKVEVKELRMREFEQQSSTGELCSNSRARKTRSMGMPPITMDRESPGELTSASNAVPELRLVLLGVNAEEKWAMAETLLGRERVAGQPASVAPTQAQCSESREGEVAGRRVTVVYTPDWFSSGFSARLRQDVRQCMSLSRPGPHAFVLVIPLELFDGEERNIPDKMEDIFGESCWEHTVILFTSTEGIRQTSMEELIQKSNQELLQLVQRCENHYHLLDAGEADASLLRKIEAVVTGNSGRFYDSQMYLEAEERFTEMEAKIQRQKEQRKEKKKRAEKEMAQQLDKTLQESMRRMEEDVRKHEGEIRILSERMSTLERKRREEQNERNIRELESELKREAAQRKEVEEKMRALKEKSEKERKEIEDRHKAELEEMRKRYKQEARAEIRRNLMKILLSENFKRISKTKKILMEKNLNLFPDGFLKSLRQVRIDDMEAERDIQRQDNQRQIEEMCVEMIHLSRDLLQKVRNSERLLIGSPEE